MQEGLIAFWVPDVVARLSVCARFVRAPSFDMSSSYRLLNRIRCPARDSGDAFSYPQSNLSLDPFFRQERSSWRTLAPQFVAQACNPNIRRPRRDTLVATIFCNAPSLKFARD